VKESEEKLRRHEYVEIPSTKDIYFEHYFDQGRLVSNHWHNELEIIYLLKGNLDVTIGNRTEHYKKSDLILINTKVVHSTMCTSPNESILVQIPYTFLKRYIPDVDNYLFYVDCFSLNPIVQTKITQLKETLQKMLIVTEYHPDGEWLQFGSLLFKLLYILYHNFKITDLRVGFQQQAKNLDKLDSILDYTQKHYNESISLDEIAEIAGFQSQYFCRLFKKNMGITYLQYLNEIRLSYIYQDLITTELTVQKILELHGFTNYKLFRRIFADKFHMTPLEMRNLQNKKRS
jgi:AraC-like DNA-binding protein